MIRTTKQGNGASINHNRITSPTVIPKVQFGNGKVLFNLKEAGEYCGLSSWTLRDLVKTGKIRQAKVPHPFEPGRFLSRPILIHRDELESFASRCNGNG